MAAMISWSIGDDDFDLEPLRRGLKMANTDFVLLGVPFCEGALRSLSRLLLRERSRGLSNSTDMALFLRWPAVVGDSGLTIVSFDLNSEQNELLRDTVTVAGDGVRLPVRGRFGFGDNRFSSCTNCVKCGAAFFGVS